MLRIIREDELPSNVASGSRRFDGDAYDAGLSFFIVRNEPGRGPDLHTHHYAETFLIRTGRALITAGAEQFVAGPGQVVVVGPATPHSFKNLGPGQLEVVCLHANDRIVSDWL